MSFGTGWQLHKRKCSRDCIFGRISEHLPGLYTSFIHDTFIQARPPLPFEPTAFFQHPPPLDSHGHVSPHFSSCDSWFPCSHTTGHPPITQHSLWPLNTQPEHTSAGVPRAKLPSHHSAGNLTRHNQRHIHLISLSWWVFFLLQGSLERCTVVFWRCRRGKRWRWLSRPWSRATRRSRGRTFWARPPSWDSFPTRTLFDWRGWSPNVRISVSFATFDTYFYKFLSISGQFGQVFSSFLCVCS